MGYTAYKKMKENNIKNFGIEAPEEPKAFSKIREWQKDSNGDRKKQPKFLKISDLELHAINFIRERCEDLGFKTSEPYASLNDLEGASLKPNQVPYNFQMDMNRRCLEVAIHRFMESGVAKDAFDVYFCYLEMFIGSYGKTKKMIEMLSEFEANASSLLMKHRDHYSHSVYVFLIGLAMYDSSPDYRRSYEKFSNKSLFGKEKSDTKEKDKLLAASFLKYWGLTALFHDIGYPFELSFEQVKSYYGDSIDYVPFVTYNMNNFQNSKVTEIQKKADALIKELSEKVFNLEQNAEDNSPSKEIEKLRSYDKKIKKHIKSIINEQDQKKYNSRPSLPEENKDNIDEEIANINPLEWYKAAIEDLKLFKAEIKDIRDKGIAKLKKLTPGDVDNDGVENLNAFLANALYYELGEDYAYYDKNTKKRFGNFEKYLNRQENRFSYDYKDYLYDVLRLKPEHPEEFGGYIDHAYFSAITLLTTLMYVVDEKDLNEMYTHALTAILLHNSLYKFSVTEYNEKRKDENSSIFNDGKHFNMQRNPLAWLLMLCDELQCWDRTSYGQNSRGEVHPFNCELNFNRNKITATYIFDKDMYCDEEGKLKAEYEGKKGTYKKLEPDAKTEKSSSLEDIKSSSLEDIKSSFLEDIENIISLNGDVSFDESNKIKLKVGRSFKPNEKYRGTYLSTSNFIHMYKFSILVHKMNHLDEYKDLDDKNRKSKEREFEEEFEKMSLEYKINHISRAKKFSKILGKIGCFYSDKPMDCEIVSKFTDEELQNDMGPIEHERWCWEHFIMGWRYIPKNQLADLAEKYKDKLENNIKTKAPELSQENISKTSLAIIRECLKLHPDMIEIDEENKKKNGAYCGYDKKKGIDHFVELAEISKHDSKSQEKDKRSMDNLLKVLNQEDGIKVYRLRKK